jgi:hypothetical protein
MYTRTLVDVNRISLIEHWLTGSMSVTAMFRQQPSRCQYKKGAARRLLQDFAIFKLCAGWPSVCQERAIVGKPSIHADGM